MYGAPIRRPVFIYPTLIYPATAQRRRVSHTHLCAPSASSTSHRCNERWHRRAAHPGRCRHARCTRHARPSTVCRPCRSPWRDRRRIRPTGKRAAWTKEPIWLSASLRSSGRDRPRILRRSNAHNARAGRSRPATASVRGLRFFALRFSLCKNCSNHFSSLRRPGCLSAPLAGCPITSCSDCAR